MEGNEGYIATCRYIYVITCWASRFNVRRGEQAIIMGRVERISFDLGHGRSIFQISKRRYRVGSTE